MQHHAAINAVRTYLRTEQHQNTRWQESCSHCQCDLQAQIPKHPITTHTQAHPKQLEATVTMRQQKRQTDPSRNRRTDEVPFIVACSHSTRKNARFRAPASSLKHSPCNIHATSTIRFAASRSKPAPIYARGNIRWQESSSHSNAICHHSFKKRIEPRTQKQALLQNT